MSPEAMIGVELGDVVIQRLVGQGTMGAVYLAAQEDRQVAVKVFLPASPLKDEEYNAFQQRLEEMIARGAALEHPYILPVLSHGRHEQLIYQVTPYIPGANLEALFARTPKLPFEQIQQYLDQLGAALDYAHAQKIVHGDIKANNVLLTSTGDLLLSDFCLATLTLEKNFASVRRPIAGMLNTIAPEYVLGQGADQRSDLYALGALLYQMVTGVPPFEGASLGEVAMKHVKLAPPAPTTLRSDLPQAAEQAMLRALAKRPADRYSHARDLAAAFRLALAAAQPGPEEERGIQALNILAGKGQTSAEQTLAPRTGGLFDPKWRAQVSLNANALQQDETGPQQHSLAATTTALPESAVASSEMPELPTEEQPTHPVPQVPTDVDANLNLSFAQMLAPSGEKILNASLSSTAQSAPGEVKGTGLLGQTNFQNFPTGQNNPYATSGPLQLADIPTSNTEALRDLAMQQQASSPTSMLSELARMPSNSDGTGTVKLTESVKIVHVPIAGQPGRFMTGYLPTQPADPPTPSPAPKRQSARMKIVSLVLAVIIVAAGSGIFLSVRSHNSQANSNTKAPVTLDTHASATAQASATANANLILSDDLSQNTNQWPTGSQNGYTCSFENGAYHITNHDSTKSASILLPGKPLDGPFTYTLTMDQIKGDQTSSSNLFGMILYATVQNPAGKPQVDKFYAFEIQNNAGGQYQFWKYDNSKNPSSPWAPLWQKNFGKEFKQGSGTSHTNTVKIIATGKMFTFIINNKQVGTLKDHSFSSGTVGMLVNLDGAEVAFSHLVLARS